MKTATTIRSPGAIALGSICALGTAIVLFWHVRSLSDITTNHVMIFLALICTLGAGHFVWRTGWRYPGSTIAFLIIFLGGTAICVTLSAGRGAEFIHRKASDVTHENAKRIALEAKLAEANTDRKAAKEVAEAAEAEAKAAREAAAQECGTGKALKCEGRRATLATAEIAATERQKRADQADSHYWMLVAQFADMKPEQVANVDLRQAGKVFAFLLGPWGVTEARAMEGIELLWPFILALITEFGTIAFLNYGFGHRRVAETVSAGSETPENEETEGDPLETVAPTVAITDAQAESVFTALKRAGRPVNNDELAELIGISKSEASKRVTALNGRVHRVRLGREVAISLPKPN